MANERKPASLRFVPRGRSDPVVAELRALRASIETGVAGLAERLDLFIAVDQALLLQSLPPRKRPTAAHREPADDAATATAVWKKRGLALLAVNPNLSVSQISNLIVADGGLNPKRRGRDTIRKALAGLRDCYSGISRSSPPKNAS